MKSRNERIALAAAAALAAACSTRDSVSSNASTLFSAVATASSSAGTLLCAPAQGQIDACASKAAGDVCSFSPTDAGMATAGMCRATIDGETVGCVPNPPAPPAEVVAACSGKVAGSTCSFTEPDGDAHTFVCATDRDGTTLVCAPVRTPPQVAVDACTGKAAGNACTFAGHPEPDGGTDTETGTCGNGPSGTGTLSCAPAQELLPDATAACAGLAAGAACTLGEHRESIGGTCVLPSSGGATVCVVACGALGGPFDCGGGPGHHGGPGHGGPGGGGTGGPPDDGSWPPHH